jgi:hypothetical protein
MFGCDIKFESPWPGTDFGKIITFVAMLNVGIPVEDRDHIMVELGKSIKDDMYWVKIRSNTSYGSLHQISEGGEYPCIVCSRKRI